MSSLSSPSSREFGSSFSPSANSESSPRRLKAGMSSALSSTIMPILRIGLLLGNIRTWPTGAAAAGLASIGSTGLVEAAAIGVVTGVPDGE